MKGDTPEKTHFGFREVSNREKPQLVDAVFQSVASRYDLMNDLMSFGLHRLWKRVAVAYSGIRRHSRVLDVAGGTGDLTVALAKKLGPKGHIVLTDINEDMLNLGQDRLLDNGIVGNAFCVRCDAENLAFEDDSFDCVVISFGLRNVTHMDRALKSMYRVLAPTGRILVLEFSKPVIPSIGKAYDLYSFNIIPKLGEVVAKDRHSYQYLVESIRKHPDQEQLADMMAEAGFERVEYFNLAAGIVALHIGRKI